MKRALLSREAWVLALLVLVTLVFTVLWMHPYVNSFTILTHGDQAWVQASAQVAMQSGPFATNDHVGWASGFNPWAYPGLGSLGFYLVAWAMGLVTASSSNALVVIMGLTAVAVSVFSYLALRLAAARPVRPFVAFWLALTLGLSPYVLEKTGHYNVAAWYLLPAVLAALGFLRRDLRLRSWVFVGLGLALVSLLSPLWWSMLADYFLLLGLVVAVVLRNWAWCRRLGFALLAVVVGGLLPAVLAVLARVPGGSWNREAWDSTRFGGSLVDFVKGSPWISSLFPGLGDLGPALSKEFSEVGLIPMIAAIVVVLLSLTAFLGFRDETRARVGWVLVTVQITLLSFLTLGLGTLQEALLFLVGAESPLRGWSRLTIMLALLGMILVAPWLSGLLDRAGPLRRPRGLVAALVASVAVLGIVTLDARSIVQLDPRGLSTIEEVPAVEFLSASVGTCPVAQLPGGTFPDFPMFDGTEVAITHYYRGFVPYLLNPSGHWSYGAAAGTATSDLFRSLPASLGPAERAALAAAGYCAVLYDRHYAEWLRARGGQWPGSSIAFGEPEFASPRFDVYVLTGT